MTPIRIINRKEAEAAEKAETARRAKRDARIAAKKARREAERAQKAKARKTTPRPPEMRNISRLESDSTKGWSVRFQRAGEKRARFFKDADHGGTDDALAAAQAWRDEQRLELGPTPKSDAGQMLTPEARDRNRRAVSQTGVTGIAVLVRDFSAQSLPYVTAYWIDPDGRRRQTSFSISRHGVEGAVRLAARARAQTSDWHGAPAMTEDEVYDAALDAVRAWAEPRL